MASEIENLAGPPLHVGERGQTVCSVNPTDNELIAEYAEHDDEEIDRALRHTWIAFDSWRRTDHDERSAILREMANVLRSRRVEAAELITLEMGKPISQAEAEIAKAAWVCDYYADQLAEMLAPEPVDLPERNAYVQFLPLGPVLAVMPWNYPFWQVLRAAAPILSAGNTLLVKPAENVTGCALLLQEMFDAAGLGNGVVETILLRGPRVPTVIEDERVAAVTLTGSERAGVSVGSAAGRSVKKCVLELGGSDAFIVLEDADVADAARCAISARFQNSGQSCIAAKRFIVVDSVAQEFVQRLITATRTLVMGDPTDIATDIGPMARHDLRDELADQVRRGLEGGDRLLTGGMPPSSEGAFYPPTIVEVVGTQSPLMQEETFGPVAAVIHVPDEASAIAAANTSRHGLSSSVWTRDLDRGARVARQLDTGACFINAMSASDPRLPFGGVKRSGYGRELSTYGLREFVNVQTVVTST